MRKAIAKHLKRRPNATAADIWNALREKPPRGLEFHEPGRGLKRYVMTKWKPSTEYPRFANIVTEERKRIKAR